MKPVRKRDRIAKFVGIYSTAALKRDLKRIARAEERSLSATVCALLRMGLARYFDLAGSNPAAERMKAQLEEILGDGSFAEAAGEPRGLGARELNRRRAAREQNDREFDDAVDEGLRAFASRSADP